MGDKDEVSQAIKGLKRDGLKGAGVYMDALMDDRKLGLEIIFEAMQEANGHAINHISFQSFERLSSNKIRVKLKDEVTQNEHEIICKHLLLAAGPFIDQILGNAKNVNWKNIILPSKGSHLYIKNHMKLENALVMTPKDGRVIFVIPREKDRILLGTTEVTAPTNFDFLDITESEIDYLIKNFNEYFPDFPIGREHIIGSYAGVRPLVRSGGSNLGKTARTHEVYQIFNNVHSISGGKYTTFRIMAEDLIQPMLQQMGISYQQKHSIRPLEKLSTFYASEKTPMTSENIQDVISKECVRTYQDLKNRIGISDFWNFESEDFIQKYKNNF